MYLFNYLFIIIITFLFIYSFFIFFGVEENKIAIPYEDVSEFTYF
jgi:hypothetical protein